MAGFVKAEKKQVPLKLALTGPTGSGKTFAALRIASGISQKVDSRIAFIDTENHSASLYSDRFDFDVLNIDPPYTVDKYIDAIDDAIKAGYRILVIDSFSHAWKGEGGLLDKKTKIDARGGNSFTNWGVITQEQEKLVSKILHSDIHTIVTMRSKMVYELVESGNGKLKPQKMGLAPIQRDDVEYEFTLVLDIASDHNAEQSKDRTSLFNGRIFLPTEETGAELIDWLLTGKVIPEGNVADFTKRFKKAKTEEELKQIGDDANNFRWTVENRKLLKGEFIKFRDALRKPKEAPKTETKTETKAETKAEEKPVEEKPEDQKKSA